ncbi:MAG: 4-hydroxythreonine-4-phosphate dehydrogenase PdxA [Pigmentiphaga sp.]|uniref:PdxA family dehydrogenase n=1 Tax=Pigmentiphaga sp. TaxID=1977564 RepID=UPI0029B0002A|nr:4-hydroxythreonine-4-phosphate dehydrogenase PdxA [Pigmentiphaga sp.]MDX3905189.1 4-hydroxythreonine-4-phosphate dehydrogenase PdxA [Pigmentiphaga sp.]
MNVSRKRIAITLGDANGIGPEIAVKAAYQLRDEPVDCVLVGDGFVLREQVSRYAPGMTLTAFDPAAGRRPGELPWAEVTALPAADYAPGEVRAAAGAATVAYVREAVRLAQAGLVDAVVGCPHSETSVARAGIPFSGYPGLIAELTGTPDDRVFLLLVSPELRIGHVTLHESVRHALGRMDVDLVVDAAQAVVEAVRRLGVPKPRLGVFGINPHAGEGGLFGDEDQAITEPAVARLRAMGLDADGPQGADVMLSERRHDVYLAMFHDQGHIPIKLLSPRQASALSVGGGVFFSSVGHGCAFDIAGQGVGDPSAVLRTVRMLAGW